MRPNNRRLRGQAEAQKPLCYVGYLEALIIVLAVNYQSVSLNSLTTIRVAQDVSSMSLVSGYILFVASDLVGLYPARSP